MVLWHLSGEISRMTKVILEHASTAARSAPRLETYPSPPPPRTKWTRRVPHPVLNGHAALPMTLLRAARDPPPRAKAPSALGVSWRAAAGGRADALGRGGAGRQLFWDVRSDEGEPRQVAAAAVAGAVPVAGRGVGQRRLVAHLCAQGGPQAALPGAPPPSEQTRTFPPALFSGSIQCISYSLNK